MLPNKVRKDKERVYNFCNTLTVVEESENNATVLLRNVLAIASRAIYTTFSSLKVICWAASLLFHNPLIN